MGAKSTGGARSKTFGCVTVRRKGMDRADGEGAATEVRGKPGEAGVPETRKKASAEGTVLNASCPQPFTEMMLRRQKCLLVFVLPKPAPLCVHLGLLITHALLHLWCGLAAFPPNALATPGLCSLQLGLFSRNSARHSIYRSGQDQCFLQRTHAFL